MNQLLYICLTFAFAANQSPLERITLDLPSLESQVAQRFNDAREKTGLKPLVVRKDLRIRQEACRVSHQGDARRYDYLSESLSTWYVTDDPLQSQDEITKRAPLARHEYDHIAVGIWFAKTPTYPNGKYWVVINPAHSAAWEAFWGHFYLTDIFEYAVIFGRDWKKQLPAECKAIK